MVAGIGFRTSGDDNTVLSLCPTNDVVTSLNDFGTKTYYCAADFDGNHAECACFNAVIPIGTNRTIYFGVKNNKAGTVYVRALAYRRIGTNE